MRGGNVAARAGRADDAASGVEAADSEGVAHGLDVAGGLEDADCPPGVATDLTVLEPIVSSVIGVTLFAETLAASNVAEWGAVGAATAFMIGGVLALARSAARVEEAPGTGSAESPKRHLP